MNAQAAHFRQPSEGPPGLGVRQSSAAFPPGTRAFGRSAKAPEGWRTARRWRATVLVAQISNLLYRRLPVGRPPEVSSACGLEIRDTADWKSALRLAALQTSEIRLLASVAVIACCCLAASAAELRIGQATVPPGTVVSVPVTCNGASGAVGAQFDVSFNPSAVSLNSISAGDSLAGHILDQRQLAPGQWRALIYSTTNGPIAPGAVVWLHFNIPTNAPDGVVLLTMTNAIVAKVAGQPVQPLAQMSGALIVSSAENFVSVAPVATGQLRMTILGPAGRVFTLQGTPDLFHWADLDSYTNESGTLLVTNTPPAGRNAYFDRTAFRSGANPPAVPAPSLADALLLPDSRMRFQLNSVAGSAWRLEGSPDLFHWGNYGVLTNSSGSLQVTNTPVARPRVYFYRVAQP